MIIDVLAAVLAALFVLNAWVTWRACRDGLSTVTQRLAHVILIWVLPFAGALLVLHLQRHHPERASGRYRDAVDAGEEFSGHGNGFRRSSHAIDNTVDSTPD